MQRAGSGARAALCRIPWVVQVNGSAALRLMACWREGILAPGSNREWRDPGESCRSVLCLPSAGHPQSHTLGQTETPGVLRVNWNPFKQRQGRRRGDKALPAAIHVPTKGFQIQAAQCSHSPGPQLGWETGTLPGAWACRQKSVSQILSPQLSQSCRTLGANATLSPNHSPAWEICGCLG